MIFGRAVLKYSAVPLATVASNVIVQEAIISIRHGHDENAKITFVVIEKRAWLPWSKNSSVLPVNGSGAMRKVPFPMKIISNLYPLFLADWT